MSDTTHVEGLLLINKPRGISSRQMLNRIKRRLGKVKIGHCGTLDPAAEGLLIVALGRATRAMECLLKYSKRYRVYVLLGTATDSGDLDGQVITTQVAKIPDVHQLNTLLTSLCGEMIQIAPKFSALKHQGKRFYQLARNNEEVPQRKRTIMIYEVQLGEINEDGFWFEVECSKGTYIRTLVEDIGKMLGTVACLKKLVRTSIGCFMLDDALSGKDIEDLSLQVIVDALISVDRVYDDLPAIELNDALSQRFCHGQSIPLVGSLSKVRVYHDSNGQKIFIGLAEQTDKQLRPIKVWGIK